VCWQGGPAHRKRQRRQRSSTNSPQERKRGKLPGNPLRALPSDPTAPPALWACLWEDGFWPPGKEASTQTAATPATGLDRLFRCFWGEGGVRIPVALVADAPLFSCSAEVGEPGGHGLRAGRGGGRSEQRGAGAAATPDNGFAAKLPGKKSEESTEPCSRRCRPGVSPLRAGQPRHREHCGHRGGSSNSLSVRNSTNSSPGSCSSESSRSHVVAVSASALIYRSATPSL
jgi:hypothetical protein